MKQKRIILTVLLATLIGFSMQAQDIIRGTNLDIGDNNTLSNYGNDYYGNAIGTNHYVEGASSLTVGYKDTITQYGYNSVAFGSVNKVAGNSSMAVGSDVKVLQGYSMGIGRHLRVSNGYNMIMGNGITNPGIGPDVIMENPYSHSLMIGFYSSKPTLTVGPSPNTFGEVVNHTGKVAIGDVPVPDIAAKLHIRSDEVSDIYHGIELDNKQFIILDVELGDRHGNQQAIRLQCVQGSVRGIQPPTPQPIYWAPFADGPNWYYGQNGGMLNSHLEGEMDAADTLANMLNTLLVPKPPVGQQYIYTEIMMKELPNNYHEPFSHNLYPGEYCEFYVHNPEQADFWLSTDQLNFHYFGERYLVCSVFFSDLTNPIPSGHSLFNIVINDYSLTSNSSTSIGHHTQAYYGHRNIMRENNLVKGNL